ncbi:sel1 repeat family protein [Planctomycetota bacterium]|nr:sel1 repeat family protein [Planctomycetota bacterium]
MRKGSAMKQLSIVFCLLVGLVFSSGACWGSEVKDGGEAEQLIYDLISEVVAGRECTVEEAERIADYWLSHYDNVKALKWADHAIEMGSVDALVTKGRALISGGTIKKDEAMGKALIDEAVKKGSDVGMAFKGVLLARGDEGKRKVGKGVSMLKRAISMGNKDAAHDLGMLYLMEKLGKNNYAKSLPYFRKGVKLGSLDSMRTLGELYSSDMPAIKKDYAKSYEYFEQAAMLGDSESMKLVAWMNQTGMGVKADPKKAGEWSDKLIALYRKRMTFEDGEAAHQLYSYCLREDIDPSKKLSDEEEIELLKKAGDWGYSSGYSSLASIYENGFGDVEKDLEEALKWYEKAAAMGNELAKGSVYQLKKRIKKGK